MEYVLFSIMFLHNHLFRFCFCFWALKYMLLFLLSTTVLLRSCGWSFLDWNKKKRGEMLVWRRLWRTDLCNTADSYDSDDLIVCRAFSCSKSIHSPLLESHLLVFTLAFLIIYQLDRNLQPLQLVWLVKFVEEIQCFH